MYREELKVLDCTIRDGGLINNYHFSDDFVKAIYAATAAAGVDYMEIGKKLCESDEYTREKYGKATSATKTISRVLSNPTKVITTQRWRLCMT